MGPVVGWLPVVVWLGVVGADGEVGGVAEVWAGDAVVVGCFGDWGVSAVVVPLSEARRGTTGCGVVVAGFVGPAVPDLPATPGVVGELGGTGLAGGAVAAPGCLVPPGGVEVGRAGAAPVCSGVGVVMRGLEPGV